MDIGLLIAVMPWSESLSPYREQSFCLGLRRNIHSSPHCLLDPISYHPLRRYHSLVAKVSQPTFTVDVRDELKDEAGS